MPPSLSGVMSIAMDRTISRYRGFHNDRTIGLRPAATVFVNCRTIDRLLSYDRSHLLQAIVRFWSGRSWSHLNFEHVQNSEATTCDRFSRIRPYDRSYDLTTGRTTVAQRCTNGCISTHHLFVVISQVEIVQRSYEC